MKANTMLEDARQRIKEDEKRKAELAICLLAYLNCLEEAVNWFGLIKSKDTRKIHKEVLDKMEQLQNIVLELEADSTQRFNDDNLETADELANIVMNIRTFLVSSPPEIRRDMLASCEYRFNKWKRKKVKR